jgi:hypothetical protein
MGTNEVLLIKGSVEDGRVRFTTHAAFEDATPPVSAPARESVEGCAGVLWATPGGLNLISRISGAQVQVGIKIYQPYPLRACSSAEIIP